MNAPVRHPAELPIGDLLDFCRVKQTRGSGPGGQHRNKVSTMVVITHEPSGITGQAGERRSQKANRSQALLRLRRALAIGIRTKRPPLDQFVWPNLWSKRVATGNIRVSVEHPDFPSMLAIVLDLVFDNGFDVSAVADCLECSTTQLVRFLAQEPAALKLVNQHREKMGKRPYRA